MGLVCGVGVYEKGTYRTTTHPDVYNAWQCMLQRCYVTKEKRGKPSPYIGCTVSKRWRNFQNFANDYVQMIGYGNGWHLDKDILRPGNRKYGRSRCCLVPKSLNNLLIKSDASRGRLPIGVTFNDRATTNPYMAQCSVKGKQRNLGYFATPDEAFLAYKLTKEKEIRRIARLFREVLDNRVYLALMKYRVLPDD